MPVAIGNQGPKAEHASVVTWASAYRPTPPESSPLRENPLSKDPLCDLLTRDVIAPVFYRLLERFDLICSNMRKLCNCV